MVAHSVMPTMKAGIAGLLVNSRQRRYRETLIQNLKTRKVMKSKFDYLKLSIKLLNFCLKLSRNKKTKHN